MEETAELKQQPGKDILIEGNAALIESLVWQTYTGLVHLTGDARF